MCSIINEKPGPDVTVKALAPPQNPALQCDRSGQLVFHLYESTSDRGDTGSEALDYFRRSNWNTPGRETCSSGQRAFTAGMIAAVNEVGAGENAMRIGFHFVPPAVLSLFADSTFFGLAAFEPYMAKSGFTDCTGRSRCIFPDACMGRMIALGIEGGRERQICWLNSMKSQELCSALTTIEACPFAL